MRQQQHFETSSVTSSRSRSSSSSTTTSRPTSTKPKETLEDSKKEEQNEPPSASSVPAEQPVEQRWEESAGMYTHKKFKKMASSVVVTSVNTPSNSHLTTSLVPLKHSALSLIEQSKVQQQQARPLTANNIGKVHVPPLSPSSSPSLMIVQEDEKRKNVCPYCNMSCTKPSVLDKHIRTHTNERPYPCLDCNIAFKTQSNLYKHCRSKTHELKVKRGIESSTVEMVAELGDSFKEELDQHPKVVMEQHGTHLLSPQVVQAVQKLQYPHQSMLGPKVLIRDEPKDLSAKQHHQPSVSFLPQPMSFRPSSRLPLVASLPPVGSSISLTNSVELSSPAIRPVVAAPANAAGGAYDYVQQRIDKVISENQAIVETCDPLWPRRYMRQGKDNEQNVVTVEKTSNRKIIFSPASQSQVTMSLVTTSSHKPLQLHNLSVPSSTASANNPPLSIQLTSRPQPPPALTVVSQQPPQPSLVVVRHDQREQEQLLTAKSVKELWINKIASPSMTGQQRLMDEKVAVGPDGSMIKELLLKTRGATTLEPAGMIERRDSNSSTSSNSSQIVLQVTKPSFDPQQVKLALPNVSLILTPASSAASLQQSKTTRILPPGLISTSSVMSVQPSESLWCNLCQKRFSGIDLELHQREYCPARPGLSIVAQLREARMPEKHSLPMQDDEFINKKPRLTILPPQQHQHQQVKSIMSNTSGSIVTVSKAPLQQTVLQHHGTGGLLQIAKPVINKIEAKSIVSTSFAIPGIPIPSMAGVLTGIKAPSSQTLFSLPGKRSLPSETAETKIIHVPGMPGPSHDQGSTIATPVTIPLSNNPEVKDVDVKIEYSKFLRPNSLPLTPGTFKTKKHVMLTGGDTLVSPETPRPRKSYMLQYQNGTAYSTLGFKSSTKVYYTTIFHQQPMYVADKPRISMYSNWRVVTKDSHPSGLSPGQSLNVYNSVSHDAAYGTFTMAGTGRSAQADCMIVSHSSKWKALKDNKAKEGEKNKTGAKSGEETPSTSSSSSNSNVVRTVEGGYKSLDDNYTYVRGRGRGRYVCNNCGIRCKKPSMLKKHIRTHSNFRPYTCKHCNFAFKTKGNLTKHMKSKTHHKKCVELGISPIPTSVPDEYNGNSATDEPGIPGPSRTSSLDDSSQMKAGDSDSELDEDMEEEEDEDEDQFEDAMEGDDDIEILHQDDGKGLVPFKPRLNTYPYNISSGNKSESEPAVIPPTMTSSGATPVIGEKYYFSKSPISNDVAKAAAETVMAIASSALNASSKISSTSCAKDASALPTTTTTTTGSHAPLPAQDILSPVKSVTLLSFIDKSAAKVVNKETILEQPQNELQAYLQAKAAAAKSNSLPSIPEEPTHHRIGSLTIERAPPPPSSRPAIPTGDHQGPRNVTMNVMDMPSSSALTARRLPQDIQLISVNQINVSKAPVSKACSDSNPSLMTSPPNKTCAEAVKAEEDHVLAKASSASISSGGASGSGGKFVCNVCKKEFPTNNLLLIHGKIHYFERPYRCDACAVSFRTHGHLQKHKRSSGHFNKVNINEKFGDPSTTNPRPFYCGDCKIGFRIHGHLAKHLRSKSHIMKLENSGKLPIGMFAEMERLGTNLNEIDTSDCETSLESLKQMAARLCRNKEITVDASNTNGLVLSPTRNMEIEIKEEPIEHKASPVEYRKSPDQYLPSRPVQHNGLALNLSVAPNDHRRASFSSSGQDEPSTDSEAESAQGLLKMGQEPRYGCNQCSKVLKDLKSLQIHQFVDHHHDGGQAPNQTSNNRVIAVNQVAQQPTMIFARHPIPGAARNYPPAPPPPVPVAQVAVPSSFNNGLANALAAAASGNLSSREGSISSDSGEGGPLSPALKCELCGLSNFASTKALQQHIFSHAQARPHVCPRCDAGFASLHQLDAHMKLH